MPMSITKLETPVIVRGFIRFGRVVRSLKGGLNLLAGRPTFRVNAREYEVVTSCFWRTRLTIHFQNQTIL